MALQGDLSEIPLPELLGLLSGKSGILHLGNVPIIGRMDLHVSSGAVSACVVGEQPLRRESSILEKLIAATIMAKGKFDFEICGSESLQHRCKIPVQGLALDVASRADEILAQREALPDASQVFRWAGSPAPATGPDPQLNLFIEEAVEMLRFGSSAQKLAEFLQISIDQARHHLAALHAAKSVVQLHRDVLWSRLDKALEKKNATPLKILRPDGTVGVATPLQPLVPRKSDSQLIGNAGQKIVPKLKRQPVNKPFPDSEPPDQK